MKEKIVFVVDDDKLIQHFLEYSLIGKEGFSVRIFQRAEDCLKSMNAKPDLIIMDHSFMFNDETLMSGLEAIVEIRNIDKQVPVIILSKSEDKELIADYESKGATAYIAKEGCFINKLFDTFDELILQ